MPNPEPEDLVATLALASARLRALVYQRMQGPCSTTDFLEQHPPQEAVRWRGMGPKLFGEFVTVLESLDLPAAKAWCFGAQKHLFPDAFSVRDLDMKIASLKSTLANLEALRAQKLAAAERLAGGKIQIL